MRVGILTQYFPPEMGAPQARLSDLARRFVDRGHDVTVLTAMPNYPTGRIFAGYGGLLRRERHAGVRVIRTFVWPTQRMDLTHRAISYASFAASAAAVGLAAFPRLDYLVTESPPLLLGPTGWILSRRSRAKWIFNVSDLWPDSAIRMGALQGKRSRSAAYALERFCYSRAWAVSGQSRGIVDDIRKRFPAVPTSHLSNGVDTRQFTPGARSAEVRSRLFCGRDVVAVYAGLHGLAQGLEQVLDAAARLRHDARLGIFLIGDGPRKRALEERVRRDGLNNVYFLPPQPKEAMPELMASADVALVPLALSLPGAVPSKLYEAMASGVSVLLAADGEAARIVAAAGAGLVVEPAAGDALVIALEKLVADPEARERMGRAGRVTAEALYDRRTICDRFIQWLEVDSSTAGSAPQR